MAIATQFRRPSVLLNEAFHQPEIPFENIKIYGEWYFIRTSNVYWKGKQNVRVKYNESGDDQFSYSTVDSDAIKLMTGKTATVPNSVATYSWQGKGLMRMFNAKWEILGFSGGGDERQTWMVTFQHKTLFTAPAINLMSMSKDGVSETDIKQIENFLDGLGVDMFRKAVEDMFAIVQV